MKILVLGAAGGVGRLVVEQAVARGHTVTAFARNPDKAAQQGAVAVQGDVLDPEALASSLTGQDAVVFAVGVKSAGPTTLFSDSTRLLLKAMQRQGVRRIICITGVGAGETRGRGGFFYDRIIFPLFTRNRYEDKERQEEMLRSSGLDWTIVRPAPFSESKPRGEFQALAAVGDAVLRKISRTEVARFVVDELETGRYMKTAPFIGYSR